MHKKSIEAAEKMKEEEDGDENIDIDVSDKTEDKSSQPSPPASGINKEELRSESIASLRAKALTYTAQIKNHLPDGAPGLPPHTHAPGGKHDIRRITGQMSPVMEDAHRMTGRMSPLTAASKLRHDNEVHSSHVTDMTSRVRDSPSSYHDDRGFGTPNHIDVVDPGDSELLDPGK